MPSALQAAFVAPMLSSVFVLETRNSEGPYGRPFSP
jgi:hypothetical protein